MFKFSKATGYVDDGEPIEGTDYYEDNTKEDSSEDEAPRQKPKSSRKSTKGRMLKRWDADEDQLLLLFCDYVCTSMGNPVPWDAIAATMEPRDPESGKLPMTGEAIKQHLAKLRQHRAKAGLRVPPALDRTARRQAVSTFARANAMQTPAATPRKGVGAVNAPATGTVRIKQQSETPTKQSTLLANVNKTKQKKAEQAKKAQMGNNDGFTAVGGVKATTGKRGRKPKSIDEDYRDDNGTSNPAPSRKLRSIEYKDYALPDIKAEEDSDDDMPLSKMVDRKTRPGVGLMNDTVAMWNNRDNDQANHAHAAAEKKTTQNAGMPSSHTGKFGDTSATKAGKQRQQQQKQQSAAGRAQNGDTNTNTDFQAYQAFGAMPPASYEQPISQFDYDMSCSAPIQSRYVFGQLNEHGGGGSALASNQVHPELDLMDQHTSHPDMQFASLSSPTYDIDSSSNSFNPGYVFHYSTAVSQPSSGDNSMNASFSSDCQNDPFGMPSGHSSINMAGLPSASTDATMSRLGKLSYGSHTSTSTDNASAAQDYFNWPNGKAMQSYHDTVYTTSPVENDHSFPGMITHGLDASLPSMGHSFDAGATQPKTPNQPALASSQSFGPAVDSADFEFRTHNTGHHSPDLSQFLNEMNDPYGAGMFGDNISLQGFSTEDSGRFGS